MSAPLGSLVEEEVKRAETDMVAMRTRAQSVLTASGALVTLLTGLLAVAVNRESGLQLNCLSKVLAGLALLAFVVATLFVLRVYWPATADAADENDLAKVVREDWGKAGYDKDVAMFLVEYLRSLRSLNQGLSSNLKAAITSEVIGVALVASLAVALLLQNR